MKNLNDFVKDRKIARRLGLKTSLAQGTGGCNPCFRPSNEASKADLIEFHAEDLKLRRAKYHRNPFAIGGLR